MDRVTAGGTGRARRPAASLRSGLGVFRVFRRGHLRVSQSGIPLWSPSGLSGQSTQRSARVSSYASFIG